ncbi:histidine triad nucleotide-binding protein [Thermobrachium celere]|uniref:Bis(5'-nucleosyl)-tetraphosphatase (Asymmetrical) n=1 Tax=Thermobrachium celere DSM 8682 TaxID=941824 RepID=R7RRU1_9CLOT|nr:histidine triad nucleotide-binding protein [Thermobrachium celere]GFR34515.1 histidine triad nucleotide-binding protein [Thermobrachium celere]CDF58071.1 Bis(5'-nucleosyl)-tetraphosphatase (asymmetrical) [Thermobrachium celere DSM 8682]
MECIFCKIVNGEIPASKVYENESVLAFKDINPVAPVHILIIPKKHYTSVLDIDTKSNILNEIFEAARVIAKELNIDESGFRLVTNTGESAGQTVKHIHFHLIGGRDMQWPPG